MATITQSASINSCADAEDSQNHIDSLPNYNDTATSVPALLGTVSDLSRKVEILTKKVEDVNHDRDQMLVLLWTELGRVASLVEKQSVSTISTSCSNSFLDSESKFDPIAQQLILDTLEKADAPPAAKKPRNTQIKRDEDDFAITGRKDSASELQALITRWIRKQKDGLESDPQAAEPKAMWPDGAWWCYACNSLATDGSPGEHFCWTRVDQETAQNRGIKVLCQYCCKGTTRMPDLRVHFRKIVYCRTLREELRKLHPSPLISSSLSSPSHSP